MKDSGRHCRLQDSPVDVRFIEMMPIGLGRVPGRSQDDILAALRKAYGQETLFMEKCEMVQAYT